ncbi:protein pxr1-like [Lycium barbarum]|uniref:protein pxr1-like n=1 Tax=Lycium barbarum TaxID=112863 RepID=UPI00293E1D1C|nr:protein pxr1-like [Lycium barbarum]XP_060199049.1 protein pxr1-like [Lycium barbarum]
MTKVNLGSEKHKEEESWEKKRDKMPNAPESSSKTSVKNLGSEKHKEEESQKGKRDKMPNTPKSSSKESVKKLGSKKHKEEESRKRKRDKMPNTSKSSNKKSESGPSLSKSPERAKIKPSLSQKTKKRSGEAQNDGLKEKSGSMDEVTASAEKYTPSARRVKVMRELGLMAPSGSPFCTREHIAAPPKSPIIPKGHVSAPKKSPSNPKKRLPAIKRTVVCGLPAAGSADHVAK